MWRTLLFFALCGGAKSQSCIPSSWKLKRSLIQSILFKLRTDNVGQIRVARATWASHNVATEIFNILVHEYLGHSIEHTDISSTEGTYKSLSEGTLDVNIELWKGPYQSEHQEFVTRGSAIDAGTLAYEEVTRSGLYVRPSKASRERLVNSGRFYSALESTVLPSGSRSARTRHCNRARLFSP
jgi:ABC-type proline/glycine betaine transport system substrate-binding protein